MMMTNMIPRYARASLVFISCSDWYVVMTPLILQNIINLSGNMGDFVMPGVWPPGKDMEKMWAAGLS